MDYKRSHSVEENLRLRGMSELAKALWLVNDSASLWQSSEWPPSSQEQPQDWVLVMGSLGSRSPVLALISLPGLSDLSCFSLTIDGQKGILCESTNKQKKQIM